MGKAVRIFARAAFRSNVQWVEGAPSVESCQEILKPKSGIRNFEIGPPKGGRIKTPSPTGGAHPLSIDSCWRWLRANVTKLGLTVVHCSKNVMSRTWASRHHLYHYASCGPVVSLRRSGDRIRRTHARQEFRRCRLLPADKIHLSPRRPIASSRRVPNHCLIATQFDATPALEIAWRRALPHRHVLQAPQKVRPSPYPRDVFARLTRTAS